MLILCADLLFKVAYMFGCFVVNVSDGFSSEQIDMFPDKLTCVTMTTLATETAMNARDKRLSGE